MDKVSFKDFTKLDVRIGTVVKAEVPDWSHWVMKLTVDFGPAFAKATTGKRERVVFAGIMKFYKPKDLEGKQFPFIVNLEPKKIGPEGDFSQGMMIMIVPKDDEETKPILFNIPEKVPNGTKVQ